MEIVNIDGNMNQQPETMAKIIPMMSGQLITSVLVLGSNTVMPRHVHRK